MRRVEDFQLTAEDRALLRAMARGGKDEIVARRLGISTRTFRRRVMRLMQRLQATSRSQVGVKAT